MDPNVAAAITALRDGRPILLFDSEGREGETDLVLASEYATPAQIGLLRRDGGGLLCTTVAPEHHQHLGLPFMADLLADQVPAHPVLGALVPDDIPYDARSSFGITLNHRDTFTGITDEDRALTISTLATFMKEASALPASAAQKALGERFRSPGHCILLNGAAGGIDERRGHTELSLALARLAGITPSTTLCEMMDGRTGKALSKKAAQAYAHENDLVFLNGQEVIDAWQQQNQPTPVAVPAPTSVS